MDTNDVKVLLEGALLLLKEKDKHHTNTMVIKNVENALAWLDSRKE